MSARDGRVPNKDGLVPPKLIGADEKKVYPPLQWWPLRVMNPWHKLAFVVAWWLLLRGVDYVIGPVLPIAVSGPLMSALSFGLLVTMARSFRGAGEPVGPPRAWWRLTARPLAGWWLGAFYLLPLLGLVVVAPMSHRLPMTPSGLIETVLSVAMAAGFLNSSIQLHRHSRRRGPTRAAVEDAKESTR